MGILKKGSKLYSIVKLKCPKCHEGNLFLVSNAWNFNKMLDMPDSCPVCKQDFWIEPGFYSGALWVSYPIVIIIALTLLSPLVFYPDYSILIYCLMGIILFSLQPIIMRWARAIWINIFVHYQTDNNTNKKNDSIP